MRVGGGCGSEVFLKIWPHASIQPPIEKILVVEDDPAVRKMVVNSLKTLGYHVIEAESGPEALKLLQSMTDIVLLFTDVVMPGGINGVELASKAQTLHPGLKVLLTSGFSAQQAAAGSPFPLLRKPYRKARLAKALDEVLSA